MPGPKTALHNVPAQTIAILGEKDGIVYGAWKGGAAGTMPIKLYLETAPGLSEESRAMMRRAAKIWSKHLVDDGLRLDDGTEVKDIEGFLLRVRLDNTRAMARQHARHVWGGIGLQTCPGRRWLQARLRDDSFLAGDRLQAD